MNLLALRVFVFLYVNSAESNSRRNVMIMKFTANVRIMVGAGLILRHPFSCKFPIGDLRENVKMCDLWFTFHEFLGESIFHELPNPDTLIF